MSNRKGGPSYEPHLCPSAQQISFTPNQQEAASISIWINKEIQLKKNEM